MTVFQSNVPLLYSVRRPSFISDEKRHIPKSRKEGDTSRDIELINRTPRNVF